jgi:hypothetical protein
MPRLSLYRPEKGNDYKFQDKTVWEMFQVGGTDVLVHKYIGPGNSQENTPSTPTYSTDDPTNIQDMLFLENRDRKYDPDVYRLRGVYNVQDIDFNLSQFGLFLQNDTVFITFHINDTVEKLGRKIMSGDVIELPHLDDEHALNDLNYALKRFYVIEDVNRAAEGFSNTWYPHLYRAKCKPLVDSQEFKQILDGIADQEALKGTWNAESTYFPGDIVIAPNGEKYQVISEVTNVEPPNSTYYKLADTLKDIMSTYEKEMQVTQAVLDQAEADSPESGYDTSRFYTMQTDNQGNTELVTADSDDLLIPSTDKDGNTLLDDKGNEVYMSVTADTAYQTPEGNAYKGYLIGDGLPENGAPFTQGIAFPLNPIEGQFHLRTDYKPTRLFRFDGIRWRKTEDDVRMTRSNLGPSQVGAGKDFAGHDPAISKGKDSFINNTTVNNIGGKQIEEKQSLSKALRPKADD